MVLAYTLCFILYSESMVARMTDGDVAINLPREGARERGKEEGGLSRGRGSPSRTMTEEDDEASGGRRKGDTASDRSCGDVPMVVVVLTMDRPESLRRLLDSLASAEYGCAPVDLLVNVDVRDWPSPPPPPLDETGEDKEEVEEEEEKEQKREKTGDEDRAANVATTFAWKHGRKSVRRRVRNAGLRTSWIEGAYDYRFGDGVNNKEEGYAAFFEDDMEVSSQWYVFARDVIRSGAMEDTDDTTNTTIASLCLHPIGNPREMHCPANNSHATVQSESRVLWTTPFVCSWGPVWKLSQWRSLVDHSLSLLRSHLPPYLPQNAPDATTFNSWIRRGFDIQSAYVKRWLLEMGRHTLVYSLTACFEGHDNANGTFFAVNKKEVGVHYKKKQSHLTQSILLVQEKHMDEIRNKLALGSYHYDHSHSAGVVKTQKQHPQVVAPPQKRHPVRTYDWDGLRAESMASPACDLAKGGLLRRTKTKSAEANVDGHHLMYRPPANGTWSPPIDFRGRTAMAAVVGATKNSTTTTAYESNDRRAASEYFSYLLATPYSSSSGKQQRRRIGIYLDVGGGDGLSNSHSMYVASELGWRGVVVEADLRKYDHLKKNRPEALVARAVVCQAPKNDGKKEVTVHLVTPVDEGVAVGGVWEHMSESYRKLWFPNVVVVANNNDGGDQGESTEIQGGGGDGNSGGGARGGAIVAKVRCTPLSELLERFCVRHVDYFNLDVEGAEASALQSVDWSKVTMNVISVRVYRTGRLEELKLGAITRLLTVQGFRYEGISPDGLNAWFIHGRMGIARGGG